MATEKKKKKFDLTIPRMDEQESKGITKYLSEIRKEPQPVAKLTFKMAVNGNLSLLDSEENS